MHDDDSGPVGGRRRMHAAAARTRRVTIRLRDGARDPDQLPLEIGLLDLTRHLRTPRD